MSFSYGWRGPNIVKDGLVLYLDPGSPNSYYNKTGTTIKDISGNGLNGSLTNFGSQTIYDSSNGGSIVFDGTNDYIDTIGSISAFSFIQNTNIFSINFWFKTNLLNTDQIFIGNTLTTGEKGFFMGFRTSSGFGTNALAIYVCRGTAGFLTSIGATNDNIITNTNWHNGCYVSNNTTIGQWYVDGVLVTTSNRSTGLTIDNVKSTGDSTRTLNLGRANYSSTAAPLTGNISNTLIYNRALSSSEVLQNYNVLKSRFGL